MKEEELIEKFDAEFGFAKTSIRDKRVIDFIYKISIEEYRKGYNRCLKDFKIPNEFGEKSL